LKSEVSDALCPCASAPLKPTPQTSAATAAARNPRKIDIISKFPSLSASGYKIIVITT
jgi:hypothetical protein